ncbi:MAG: hypothetical protein KF901_13835 [Myxococcales bacterium]|nr:hypothetical protein [Myxococcales bacterium]
MPVASIILGIVALLFMVGGFLMTGVPVAGAVLSFGAPIAALVGIVLAGVSMSRAKREGSESGAAVAGLVINIVSFILGLAVALTCGLCNVCFTSAAVGAGSAAANNPFRQGQNPFLVPGQGAGTSFAGELSRISLSMNLATVQIQCATDPTGARAAQSVLHPGVVDALQGQLCAIDDEIAEAYAQSCEHGERPCSSVAPLGAGPDAERATALGLDPSQCFVYTSGQGRIIGCNTAGADFRLIHLENVTAVE